MTQVRVLAGTHKGGFVLTSDGNRDKWEVSGPHFAGWDVYHMKGSPADPSRIWASQHTEWFGQIIQRSDDGGRTWQPVGNDFAYVEPSGEHLWYDGTSRPFEFKRIWHLEPSLTDPDAVYAGAEDAALYRSADGGASWAELPGLRQHATAGSWQPGAGGMCLHTIIVQEARIYVAISAAGTFRSDDAGVTWQPVNKGLHTDGVPDPDAETGHCVHHVEAVPGRPDTLFMQKHWDVMRSDDGGLSWREISGNLPTDFGFPIAVHPHEPETVYVVPITSDSLHYPPEGRLQVWRSRTGGGTWEPLTAGLPQQDCYVNVYRDAMAVDTLDEAGIYFGTTGGQVYTSADAGDTWTPIVRDLPAVFSVEVQVLP
jgi:photosystem II stability/assembly factor-like uncharacterized protein